MERDFLGSGLKISPPTVKEEIDDNDRDELDYNKGPASQRTFLNKITALPHVACLGASHGQKDNKIISDHRVSSGFCPFRAVENARSHMITAVQEPITCHAEGSTHLALPFDSTPYINKSKMFQVSNQSNSVPGMKNSFRTYFNATMKQQLPRDVTGNDVKSAGPPSQLTNFYAGTVNVYNGISPEKAQTVMALAGDESSVVSSVPPLAKAFPIQAPILGHVMTNSAALVNPNTESHLSSPLSVSSSTGSPQSGSESTSTCTDTSTGIKIVTTKLNMESDANNLLVATTEGISSSPSPPANNLLGDPKTADVMKAVTGTAIPQARKASLARFLEKRKERVKSAAPYNLGRKSEE